MTRVIVVVGLVTSLVVVSAWRLATLPAALAGRVSLPSTSVAMAFHVHTNRSDGTGTVDEVAAAAAAAGVRVVVLSDHGDGTRTLDPPRYVHEVLVLDAVELSTWGGHYVAVGARPSPFPLGGAPDSVVEDVSRLGGLGVAAHPGSSKDELRWRGWDAPFDGIEWLNADSEWRDRPQDLWTALITYPWRPPATLASLLHRPEFELREWDRQTARRRVVALAAHDAHARLGLRGAAEPYDGWVALRAPSYLAMFRAFTNVVVLDRPLEGNAARDAAAVVEAIGRGATYAVITAGQAPPPVRWSATVGAHTVTMGEHSAFEGPVTLTGDVDTAEAVTSSVVCDGRPVVSASGGHVTWMSAKAPGACRLEVTRPDRELAPWIVTNPMYIRPVLVAPAPAPLGTVRVVVPVAGSATAEQWTAETSAGSAAAMAAGNAPNRLRWSWRLGPGPNPFAAVRIAAPPALRDFDRLILRISADRPRRLWVQVRASVDGGHRWGRSVYVDETHREVALPFARLLPLDPGAASSVRLDLVRDVLLVVDTVHARPGDQGTVILDELWLGQ